MLKTDNNASFTRFLREDEAEAQNWNDQLAVKYEQSLYREFAVANLKHYKSGNVRYNASP